MASHGKKRKTLPKQIENTDPEGYGDAELNDSGEEMAYEEGVDSDDNSDVDIHEEVQVEFEAHSPIDSDFDGIKRLLQQLFLKASVNLSELTDLIISQNYVGSIIKQSVTDIADDSDEDDDDEIFGFTTVMNISEKKDKGCIQQVTSLLLEKCGKCCPESEVDKFQKILSDESRCLGLLLNERFVNVPPQIALPQYQSLEKDINKAVRKGMKYEFDYFVRICKTYKEADDGQGESSSQKKKKNKSTSGTKNIGDLQFINAEDEYLHQEAVVAFNYPVTDDSDSVLAGRWSFDDIAMKTYRTVLIVPMSKFSVALTQMQEELSV
ncbi:BRCA2 and CDKN1A-interacting protein-like [Glandiceps talaboti]